MGDLEARKHAERKVFTNRKQLKPEESFPGPVMIGSVKYPWYTTAKGARMVIS
jgi:hypothetical protein